MAVSSEAIVTCRLFTTFRLKFVACWPLNTPFHLATPQTLPCAAWLDQHQFSRLRRPWRPCLGLRGLLRFINTFRSGTWHARRFRRAQAHNHMPTVVCHPVPFGHQLTSSFAILTYSIKWQKTSIALVNMLKAPAALDILSVRLPSEPLLAFLSISL